MHTHIANPVRVTAVRILEVTDVTNRSDGKNQSSPDLVLRLEDGAAFNGTHFKATAEMTARHVPVPGDYLVKQDDGYIYVNPKDVFERKYSAAPVTDGIIEAEIVAKGKTAPRITPDDVEANIAAEHFFTAAHGVEGAIARGECWATVKEVDTLAGERAVVPPLHLLTFCVLTLRNGFTVTGESACASPENFDAEIGRKIARQNAVQKIWPLMGYALRSQLVADAKQFVPA